MKKNETFEITEATIPVIKQLAEHMPGGFFVYRADETEEFLMVNSTLIRMMGCEDEADFKKFTKNTFRGFVFIEDLDTVEKAIEKQIESDDFGMDYVEYRIRRKDGDIRWVRDYGHFVHTETYGDLFYVFINDYTEQYLKEVEEKRQAIENAKLRENILRELSYTDILTGLENRRAYEEKVTELSYKDALNLGVLFCDVNGLKRTNDNLGHEVGDKLVIQFSTYLKEYFPISSKYRISGDEFVIICENINKEKFDGIVDEFTKKIKDNNWIASIGAIYGNDHVRQLINKAETKMYDDKEAYYRQKGFDRRRR